jgi:hypothetical protein
MGSPWKYWRFVRFDAAGNRKVVEIAAAKACWEQYFNQADMTATDANIQQHFIQLVRNETAPITDRQTAELCLRCFISWQLEQVCIELADQFGQHGRFDRTDLFPYVLNDIDITQPLTLSQDTDAIYQPLAYKILLTFDPQQSMLSTWTRRLAERDNHLNAYLQECGVYRISDWAMLNHETRGGLKRKLSHVLTQPELQHAAHLLKAYHAIYREDRLAQNQTGKKCMPPNTEQLQRMADYLQTSHIQLTPPQVLQELRTLAQQLRQSQTQMADPLDEQLTEQASPDPDPIDILLTAYLQEFLHCIDQAIEKVVEAWFARYSKKPPTHENFLLGLHLFHCDCRSMGEFAPEVGLSHQYQVSRLLRLEQFWQDVRRETIELMYNHDQLREYIADYINLSRLDSLDQQLENALNQLMAELRADANSPYRSGKSLLSMRLCAYLNHRRKCS